MTTHKKSPKRFIGPLVVLALIAFVIYGLYMANRPVRAPLQGQIDARYIDVSSKITGRVAELHVVEGGIATGACS